MKVVENNNNSLNIGSLSVALGIKDNQGMAATPSKVIELGRSYRIFVPMIEVNSMGEKDIMVAVQPGRKLEKDKLNRTFVPINKYTVDENNKVIDNSGLIPYARLSRILHDAECAAEKSKAEREAEQNAKDFEQELDGVALSNALHEIEVKYHGDFDAKPNAIYATLNPAIGGMTIEIATEVLVVPLDKENVPEFGKVQSMQLSLSKRKAQQLAAAMSNKDYYDKKSSYMELHYAYIGTNRKDAGQSASLNGVSKDVSLASKYPDLWEANKSFLNRLPKSPESIKARNSSMSSNLTPAEVVSMFETYISKHQAALLYLDYEDESVQNSAKDLLNLQVVQKTPKVKNKLTEIVEEQEDEVKEQEVVEEDTVHEIAKQAEDITSLSELEEAANGLDNLDDITSSDIDEL